MITRDKRDARVRVGRQELRGATADDVQGRGVFARGFEPVRGFTQLGATVQIRAGEEVGAMTVRIHAPILAAAL